MGKDGLIPFSFTHRLLEQGDSAIELLRVATARKDVDLSDFQSSSRMSIDD